MTDENQTSESEVEATITLDEAEPMSGQDQEEVNPDNTGTDQEQKPEKLVLDERAQNYVNAMMADNRRKERASEEQVKQLNAQLTEVQGNLPQNQRPSVPDMPGEYDFDTPEEFKAAVSNRDTKIRDLQAFETRQETQQQVIQLQQQQQLEAQQEQTRTTMAAFQDNAKKHGVSDADLNQSINQVNAYGISPDLGMHIMSRPDGPLITKYLASNPMEMDNLNSVSPLEAAVYVETQIASKAAALKPKTTESPDPVETLRGAGNPLKQRGPKGAKFE